ncbi:MAG: MFS transporter [Clostridia bacterium]|nr:MFS transporter [Clostridia bacterium]
MTKSAGKKAFIIGFLCIATYIINYYLRNMLSVFSPQLYETGLFSVEHVGLLSSTYMVLYAVGQVVNGFLGDFLSPKKIITMGICLSGLSSIAFPFVKIHALQILCFALLGFGLSMFRGPLMKIISENTQPNYARTICVFFSFASCAGPLIASMFALINSWMISFVIAGVIALLCAAAVFVIFTRMENKGTLTYSIAKSDGIRSIFAVFKIERVTFFIIITCVIEIVSTSVIFWIPTYLTSVLKFDNNTANLIYSASSVLRAVMSFVTLFVFKILHERDIPMLRACFAISTLMFAFMIFAGNKWLNLTFLFIALLAISMASTLLWSIYIPSLGKTGRVSSINGVIDGAGYVAAAVSTTLFATAMENVGWSLVIVMWVFIAAVGVAATFYKSK